MHKELLTLILIFSACIYVQAHTYNPTCTLMYLHTRMLRLAQKSTFTDVHYFTSTYYIIMESLDILMNTMHMCVGVCM